MEQTMILLGQMPPPDSASLAGQAGLLAGQAGILIALLAGVCKCHALARRPTANPKCMWALMLLLLAWMGMSVIAFMAKWLPDWKALVGLAGLGALGCMVAAFMLAILGLRECSRHKEVYSQGRAQAIWTLVLASIIIGFTILGAIRGREGAASLRAQPSSGQPLRLEEWNCRFTAPGKPWVQLDAGKINRDAKLAFMRTQPASYCMLIAEKLDTFVFDNEQFAELTLGHMRSASGLLRETRRLPRRVHGLHGLLLEIDAQVSGQKVTYVNWVCTTNGWAYQLLQWGRQEDRAQLLANAPAMMERFDVLDYQRRPVFAGVTPAADFVSTNFQFRVRWANSAWYPWASQAKDMPMGSFGALHQEDAALMVSKQIGRAHV